MEKDDLEIFLELVTDENFRDLVKIAGIPQSVMSRWAEPTAGNVEEMMAAKKFVEHIHFNIQQLDTPEINTLLKKIMDHPI